MSVNHEENIRKNGIDHDHDHEHDHDHGHYHDRDHSHGHEEEVSDEGVGQTEGTIALTKVDECLPPYSESDR